MQEERSMIKLSHVTKVYENGHVALKNINLEIRDGEFVFIVGRSGAGKSTLFHLLTREIRPTEGRLLVNDVDLAKLRNRDVPRFRRTLGVIYQDFRLLPDRTVYENIAFAQRVIGEPLSRIRENVPEMLMLTGLSSKYKNLAAELSGGEQQRTAIARALVNRPQTILADEPTGNLDEENSREVMRLLSEINARGTTVIVITHSRETVERMGKRVIGLDHGSVAFDTGAPRSSRAPVRRTAGRRAVQ